MANDQKGLQELIQNREKQIEELREQGIDPFPYKFETTHTNAELTDSIEERVKVAGRIMAARNFGGSTFFDLYDHTGKIQAFASKKELGAETYSFIKNYMLRGDIIGIEGTLFNTKTGELTVKIEDASILTKSTRPLPEKWHGVKNPDLIYRQRCLDLMMNQKSRETFTKRSKAITLMREILERDGYMEVEIPTLQSVYGGASARPFTTHLNALDMDVFLSISPELYLKRLVVGGYFNGVYTICKNFRNEGIDRTHNPEFTMMECYKAFWDYNDLMKLTENMWQEIFERVNGSPVIEYGKEDSELGRHKIDLSGPWARRPMLELVHEHTGLDVSKLSEADLREAITEPYQGNKPYLEGDFHQEWAWGELVQKLFEEYVEPKLIQPTFVTDHPRETTPLCKWHRNGDTRLIERFEPFIYGMEIANAYTELNDPILQRKLFVDQSSQKSMEGEPPEPIDEYFCRAIEYGMPPTGGLGIGIDRMAMLLTQSHTIKEVIFFPFMKHNNE